MATSSRGTGRTMRLRDGVGGALGPVFVLCMLLSAGACRGPGPLLEAPADAPAWPPPPARPRIRYVGELRSSKDLKPGEGLWQRIGSIFLGEKEPGRLFGPRDVVVLRDRWVWVADPGGRCIHLFDLEGRRYLRREWAGKFPLMSPVGLACGPGDSVYVCDSEAGAIHRFEGATGRWLERLTLPPALRRPVALRYDGAAGELFVVDIGAHDLKVLDPRGCLLRVLGSRGTEPGTFNFPTALALDGTRLWVVDSGNQRVQALSRDGRPLVVFGRAGDAYGDLALPKGIALDSEGHLFVVDGRFENVQIFDPAGRLLLFFGEEGTGPGRFWLPGGIFIDGRDRIWVCDAYNGRVQVFQYLKGDEK